MVHPLDPISPDEIKQIAGLVKAYDIGKGLHFKYISIIEPPKSQLRKFLIAERNGYPAATLTRHGSALYYERGTSNLFLATVNLDAQRVEENNKLDSSLHAQVDPDEARGVREACLEHPLVIEQIKKYKLPEDFIIDCDPWPYGRENEHNHARFAQCYLFARQNHPGANHYDLPLPFSPVLDFVTKELIDIIRLPTGADAALNHDQEYVPHKTKEYYHDLQCSPPRTDLKPLFVQQPDGVSFGIDGHLITWQKWRFRLGFNWREGMILHDVTYDGRELFHRLSLCEMFVPYGDPRNPYSRKSVFDVGDIGAGVACNNLALGCDCLGLIKYFDFVVSDSSGNVVPRPNAVCMHEIDDGIGWKHTNTASGAVSIVRSRVLVLQSIITVGNYEYIFLWHFDQAAGLHYKIQATGVLSTSAIDHGITVPFGTIVNKGVMAPFHQHVFCLRIDPTIDGDNNTLIEQDSVVMPWDDKNPYGVGYVTETRELTTATHSDLTASRTMKIINPSVINQTSQHPVAYAIHSPVKQMLLAHPESWHGKRARYAYHPFWVTPYKDGELYAAGDYTYQSMPLALGDSSLKGDLANWAHRGESTANTDIVIWHSISLTHNPRPEDYPVMPCDTMTVSLKPSGFFEQNPALDVPQSTQKGNHSSLIKDEDLIIANNNSYCSGKREPKL